VTTDFYPLELRKPTPIQSWRSSSWYCKAFRYKNKGLLSLTQPGQPRHDVLFNVFLTRTSIQQLLSALGFRTTSSFEAADERCFEFDQTYLTCVVCSVTCRVSHSSRSRGGLLAGSSGGLEGVPELGKLSTEHWTHSQPALNQKLSRRSSTSYLPFCMQKISGACKNQTPRQWHKPNKPYQGSLIIPRVCGEGMGHFPSISLPKQIVWHWQKNKRFLEWTNGRKDKIPQSSGGPIWALSFLPNRLAVFLSLRTVLLKLC